MRKFLLLLTMLSGLGWSLQAQVTNTTIQNIQTVSTQDLAACIDSSSLNGDTVTITGVVVTYPDSCSNTTTNRGQLWMRSGYGDFSGLDVIQFFDPSQNGFTSVLPGDSISITGVVDEFGAETELIPYDGGPSIQILGAGATITSTVVDACDLNDSNRENQITTGERWEGQYVELQDVTVTSVDFFSGGTRVSFNVENAAGCVVNISDRFLVQRLPNGNPAGSFVPPSVGDKFDHIRGVVAHSANGCTGAGGRGYEVYPTRQSDYDLNDSLSCPTASTPMRNLVTPTSSQAVTVSSNITTQTGVSGVVLNYAVGVSNNTYNQVTMTNSGTPFNGTWSGDIPAQADGSFVKYYITVTDSASNVCSFPDVPGAIGDPLFYTVRDNGTTIYDVQFVPSSFSVASSGYRDMEVTVEGVVTASAQQGNLGFVFVQQENELAWAGTMLTGNPSLATLTVGEKISVTGTVRETFGFTRIEDVTSLSVTGTGTINPLTLDPSIFTSYDQALNEPYEGMLIQLEDPGTGDVVVVEQNADGPDGGTPNFAEWRVGGDPFTPSDGCRVLTARVTNSAYSSLDVSWVNDLQWATVDGIMNVPPIVVQAGDNFDCVTGVIAYTFGNMKILPRNNDDFCTTVDVEAGLDHDIVAYPNPVAEQLRVNYTFNSTQLNATAEITDLMGRTLKVIALNELAGLENIDTSNLADGTYILRISSDNAGMIRTMKFNKVH